MSEILDLPNKIVKFLILAGAGIFAYEYWQCANENGSWKSMDVIWCLVKKLLTFFGNTTGCTILGVYYDSKTGHIENCVKGKHDVDTGNPITDIADLLGQDCTLHPELKDCKYNPPSWMICGKYGETCLVAPYSCIRWEEKTPQRDLDKCSFDQNVKLFWSNADFSNRTNFINSVKWFGGENTKLIESVHDGNYEYTSFCFGSTPADTPCFAYFGDMINPGIATCMNCDNPPYNPPYYDNPPPLPIIFR